MRAWIVGGAEHDGRLRVGHRRWAPSGPRPQTSTFPAREKAPRGRDMLHAFAASRPGAVPDRVSVAMSQPSRIALGADHGGFELKQQLKDHLSSLGHTRAGLRDPQQGPGGLSDHRRARSRQLVASGECRVRRDGGRRRHRVGDGRQQGARRAGRGLLQRDAGAQQPRAQRRQRADARRRPDDAGGGAGHRRRVPGDRAARPTGTGRGCR